MTNLLLTTHFHKKNNLHETFRQSKCVEAKKIEKNWNNCEWVSNYLWKKGWSMIIINYLHFIIFGLVVRNFFVTLLLNKKFDGISNELGMFLDNLFNLFLLLVFNLVFFQVKNNFGTTTNGFSISISFDSERTTGRGLPKVLKNK